MKRAAIDLRTAARHLGTGYHAMLEALRATGVLHDGGSLHNAPKTELIRQGFFECQLVVYHTGRVPHLHNQVLATGNGLVLIQERLQQHGLATNEPVVPAEQHRAPSEQDAGRHRDQVLRLAGVKET